MKAFLAIILLAVLTCMTAVVTADSSAPQGVVSRATDQKALSAIDAGDWQAAVVALAAYEQHLLSTYPAPTFEMQLFQDEASHLSFHSAFDGWKRPAAPDANAPAWLPSMGFHILLTLEGTNADDKLMLLGVNWGQIKQRIGQTAAAGSSDEEMQLFAAMFASSIGEVRTQDFKTMGGHRVLAVDVATPALAPSVSFVNLQHERWVYAFALVSSRGNLQQNQQRLAETVKTVDFTYRLSDRAAVKSVRSRYSAGKDPRAALACARELAALGAYDEAAEDVARLRSSLLERIQPAAVTGTVGRMPAYGVVLVNPDERKWKISAENQGPIQMLVLEDRNSVKQEGMGVMALNTVALFGPEAAKALESDAEQRAFLIGAGRGGAMSLGAIENEQFTTFKDTLAYEATIKTGLPGVRGRVTLMLRPGHMLGIFMLVDAANFDARAGQYQQILNGEALRVEAVAGRR